MSKVEVGKTIIADSLKYNLFDEVNTDNIKNQLVTALRNEVQDYSIDDVIHTVDENGATLVVNFTIENRKFTYTLQSSCIAFENTTDSTASKTSKAKKA